MDLTFQSSIPPDFSDDCHVWIYQSSRAFTISEVLKIKKFLEKFIRDGEGSRNLRGYSGLFFKRFIVLMADEIRGPGDAGSFAGKSFKFIKRLGRDFQVELFDRLMVAFIIHEKIRCLPLSQLNSFIEKRFITPDTLYFNNTILTKKELLHNWIIPVKESWLATRTRNSE